jgi:ligand-binding sensor domain-containing protein
VLTGSDFPCYSEKRFLPGEESRSSLRSLSPPRTAIISFLIVVALTRTALSELRFTHITAADGLSQDIVTSIVQDSRGFMWFGTEDGLNRYDGYSVKVYKHNPRDSHSIASNRIRCLIVDAQGNLWTALPQGMARYDESTDTFINYSTGFDTYACAIDSSRNLWIGTTDWLRRYDPGSDSFLKVASDTSNSGNARAILALEAGANGNLWIGTATGLYEFSTASKSHSQFPLGEERHTTVRSLAVSGDTVWAAINDAGLRMIDTRRKLITFYTRTTGAFADDRILELIRDRHGAIWAGTFNGLERLAPSSQSFEHFKEEKGNPHSLLGERVYSIYEEGAGAMWIGTYRGGVSRWDPLNQQFEITAHSPLNPGTPQRNDILAILVDCDQNLWIGDDAGGISRRSAGSRRFSHLLANPLLGSIVALTQDSAGTIWAGSNHRGIVILDPEKGTSRKIPVSHSGISSNKIRSLYTSPDGSVWIGYEQGGGLTRYDPEQKRFFQYLPSSKDSILGIWHITSLKSGRLLLGSMYGRHGAYVFDPRTGHFDSLLSTSRGIQLQLEPIRTSFEDDSGTLWLGSWGGGIYSIVPATGESYHWTELDGLADDYVKGMLPDGRGNLWISTENGISRFSLGTHTFKNYSIDEGLPGNFFWSGSCTKGADGTLYFGGTNGLVSFHPERIVGNAIPPPTVITQFIVLNEPYFPFRGRIVPPDIELTHDKNTLSFDFVALGFSSPEKSEYAYKMEGVDDDWIHAGKRRYASYTHLDPGTYTFRVRASNSDGVWNTTGDSLRFTIVPPYWQTLWFRGSIIAIVGALLYSAYRYRIRRILELELLRSRIAADLHDEVGSELGHIAIASQLLSRKVALPEKEQSQLASISESALHASEMMRDIVWFLNPRNDALDSIILKMRTLASSLPEEITVHFDAPAAGVPDKLDPDVKRNLVLIYKEILHNIMRHARASELWITLRIAGGKLSLVIKDNGIGFDPAHAHNGNGLGNMRSRALRIKSTLAITSHESAGTEVKLEIRM